MSDAREIYQQGFQRLATGEVDRAIEDFRRAVAADPALAIAWNALSMALGRAGHLDEAIEAAKKLVELEPDEPLSHTNLSRVYQQNGMIPEAEEERAIAMQLEVRAQEAR